MSSIAPWTTYYYVSDSLSVRMTLDSSGNVLGRQAHLPFGEDFGESGAQQKHHFTSYERDSETGMDYAINRHYSIIPGRFLSVDSYQSTSLLENPQSLNRYSYSLNDAINLVDPDGLNAIPVQHAPPPGPGQDGVGINAASTCSIILRLGTPSKSFVGNYPGYSALWGREPAVTGEHETFNASANGAWWFYAFEVIVNYPGIATIFDPYFYTQEVSEVESWYGLDRFTGKTYPFFGFRDYHDDNPDNGFFIATPFQFYSLDTPGIAKTQRKKITNSKGKKKKKNLEVDSGEFIWRFTIEGWDANRTFSCKKSFTLILDVPRHWEVSFP